MSILEHVIENAISAVKDGIGFNEYAEAEVRRGNAHGYSSKYYIANSASYSDSQINLADIWEIANYIVYTHDVYRDD